MDEGHALGELFVAVHHGRLRDAVGGILVQALDDEREAETRRAADLAPGRKHGKGRQWDAVIDQQLLRQILAARQHEPARIAPCIRDPQQLEIARDVLIVDRFAVKLLEQIENHIGFPAFDLVADRLELVLHAERPDLVAGRRATCSRHRTRSSNRLFPARCALRAIRRYQVRVHEHQHAKALHSAATAAATDCKASAPSLPSARR